MNGTPEAKSAAWLAARNAELLAENGRLTASVQALQVSCDTRDEELRELRASWHSLGRRAESYIRTIASLSRENVQLLEIASATQARCTELLEAFRVLPELEEVAVALVRARQLHPEGTTYEDFEAEVAEARHARQHEGPARLVSELLDAVVTGIRVIFGGDRRDP